MMPFGWWNIAVFLTDESVEIFGSTGGDVSEPFPSSGLMLSLCTLVFSKFL